MPAKIPDPSRLAVSQISEVGSVASVPRAARTGNKFDTIQKTIADVGRAVDEYEVSRNRYQMNKASADFTVAVTHEDNAYDEDPKYGTMVDRYTKQVNEDLNEAAQSITDPVLREEFINKQRGRIAQGVENIRDKSRLKERDHERGYINDKLNDLREVSLVGDMLEADEQVSQLLDSAVEVGYYGAEERSKVQEAWRQDTAVGKLKMMPPEDRVKALKEDWAKNLNSDTRSVLLRDAEEALLNDNAIDRVDTYMAKGLDRGEAMKEMGKISNAEEREATEARFDYALGKMQKAEAEAQSEIFDKHYLDVRSGKKRVADIPVEDIEALSPAQQNSLFAAQSASVKPSRTYSDRRVIDTLNMYRAANQPEKVRGYFTENAHLLSQADFNSWSKVSADGSVPPEVDSLLTAKQMMTSKLVQAGMGNKKSAAADLDSALNSWYMQTMGKTGKAPTDTEVKAKIDNLMIEYDTNAWWVPGGHKRGFELTEDARNVEQMEQLREDDPEMFKDVADQFSEMGVSPNHDEFMEAYTELRSMRSGP